MFEDDEEDDYKMSELEEWYDNNFGYFRRDSKTELGVTLDIALFYNGIYRPVMQELAPQVRKLMLKQFPLIGTEYRPMVLEHIDWIVSRAGHRMLMNLYVLIQDQKEGVNLREKYPDFERWIDFYARPPEPPVPDYSFFEKYPDLTANLTAEQKKEIVEEECESKTKYFYIQESTKTEYYDIIQPIVFKYYKALQDLDYDGWIIYAVEIREDYEEYKYRCEHVETFIEYEFEEEDINFEYKDFQEKFTIKYRERWEKEHPSNGTE